MYSDLAWGHFGENVDLNAVKTAPATVTRDVADLARTADGLVTAACFLVANLGGWEEV